MTEVAYARDSVTMLAPADYKALHPIGAATSVITDGDIVLAESGAVVDYIVAKYGAGRLTLAPSDPDFANFLYWLHFANGTLQPSMGWMMILNRLKLAADNPVLAAMSAAPRSRDGSRRGAGGAGAVSRGRRLHHCRHHAGLFADDDALFPTLRSVALPEHS